MVQVLLGPDLCVMEEIHESERPSIDSRPVFNVWSGLALVAEITAAIVAPLVIIGGIGFLLDWYLDAHKWVFLASALIAFVVTNVIVYRRAQAIIRRFK